MHRSKLFCQSYSSCHGVGFVRPAEDIGDMDGGCVDVTDIQVKASERPDTLMQQYSILGGETRRCPSRHSHPSRHTPEHVKILPEYPGLVWPFCCPHADTKFIHSPCQELPNSVNQSVGISPSGSAEHQSKRLTLQALPPHGSPQTSGMSKAEQS